MCDLCGREFEDGDTTEPGWFGIVHAVCQRQAELNELEYERVVS